MRLHNYFIQCAFATLVFGSPTSERRLSPQDVCLTPECIESASQMLSSLHPDRESMDPCNNFHQYACGGWHTQHPEEEANSTLGQIGVANKYILKHILDRPYPGNNDSSADRAIFNMMTKNYKSCMNQKKSDNSSLHELQRLTSVIINFFPAETGNNTLNKTMTEQDKEGFAKAIAFLSKKGIMPFGELSVVPDPQNPDVMIPKFAGNSPQSDHALPSESYLASINTIPAEKIKDILTVVGPEEWRQSVDVLSRQVLQFATAYALSPGSTSPEFTYYATTIQNATRVAPYLVFDRVFKELAPSNCPLERMVFQYPEIYGNASALIAKTPRSVIQAAMMVVAYNSYLPYITGYKETEDQRWNDFCFNYVDTSLPWIAGKFFLDKAYSAEKREFFDTLAKELKNTYVQRVLSIDWLSNDTKKLVQEKISNLLVKIGYPESSPNATNSAALEHYYSGINITDNLYRNALSIREWDSNRTWNLLEHPVDRAVWAEFGVHSYVSNSRYGSELNHAMITSGVIQAPVYYSKLPSYLPFSSIGLIVGHEMTHALDTNGRLWNEKRQFIDSWDKTSIAKFNNRTACMIKQYSKLRAVDQFGDPLSGPDGKPLFINGTNTISENIADGGGLATAYEAWVQHEKKEPSQLLPGLENFSKEQLFFISFAQTWCSKETAEGMAGKILTDLHSPPFARVLGALQNSRAFSDAWKCNKTPVCELW